MTYFIPGITGPPIYNYNPQPPSTHASNPSTPATNPFFPSPPPWVPGGHSVDPNVPPPVTELPPNFSNQPSAQPKPADNIPIINIDPRDLATLRQTYPNQFFTTTTQVGGPFGGQNPVATEYFNPNIVQTTTTWPRPIYSTGPGITRLSTDATMLERTTPTGEVIKTPSPYNPFPQAPPVPNYEQQVNVAASKLYNAPPVERIAAGISTALFTPYGPGFVWKGMTGDWVGANYEAAKGRVQAQYEQSLKPGTQEYIAAGQAGVIRAPVTLAAAAPFIAAAAAAFPIAAGLISIGISAQIGTSVASAGRIGGFGGALNAAGEAFTSFFPFIAGGAVLKSTVGAAKSEAKPPKPPTVYESIDIREIGPLGATGAKVETGLIAQANAGARNVKVDIYSRDIVTPAQIDILGRIVPKELEPTLALGKEVAHVVTTEPANIKLGPINLGKNVMRVTDEWLATEEVPAIGFGAKAAVQTAMGESWGVGINIFGKASAGEATFGGVKAWTPEGLTRHGEFFVGTERGATFKFNKLEQGLAEGEFTAIRPGQPATKYPVEISFKAGTGGLVDRAALEDVIKTRQPPANKTPFAWDVSKAPGPVIKNPFGYLREAESGGQKLAVMPKAGEQLGLQGINAALQKAASSAANVIAARLEAPATGAKSLQLPRPRLATLTRERTATETRQRELEKTATLERTVLLARTAQKEATLQAPLLREVTVQKQVLETRQLERQAVATVLPRAPQGRLANMMRFAKEKKRQPLPVRQPLSLFPRRDPLTREFEGLHRPFGEWGRPLKPLPQTEAARAAYARKLYGPGLATFRFGPEDIRKEMERRAKA